MQRFFSYSVSTMCGTPSIVPEGTPDDWANLRARTDALGDLGLGNWGRVLRPVADQLHAASLGRIDRDFWCRIYKPISASGGDEVVGWVNALFPFLGDDGVQPNPALDTRNRRKRASGSPQKLWARAPSNWACSAGYKLPLPVEILDAWQCLWP